MHPSGHERPETNTAEEWEQVRRSVAMLPPGSWAMRREQVLGVLEVLIGLLRRRNDEADERADARRNDDAGDGPEAV